VKAVGVVLSNIHDGNIPELTNLRSVASVPFGGRYRLVDFALSNMVNAGINKVGIITKNNYRSLMDHIGTGRDWDLARKNGGLFFLPPFFDALDTGLYETRLQALGGALGFLEKSTEEYIVLSDTDGICNLDFDAVLDEHIEKDADITCVYKEMTLTGNEGKSVCVIQTDDKGYVFDISGVSGKSEKPVKCVVNMWVAKRTLIMDLVKETMMRDRNASFELQLIGNNLKKLKVAGYRFDGYFAWMTSLERYYAHSMELLNQNVRDELFNQKHRAVFTKVRDSAPTSYRANADVKNSVIADGCIINGKVENCILFRGVTVGKGSAVKNCVLMQDSTVGDDCTLDSVIADKNVVVRNGRRLAGCDALPYFIAKNRIL
jgi:glucose-1-phosphate adenylyltransferase